MIEEKDVKHVANLARLHLTNEEVKKFAIQLDRILEHANKISEIDTSEVVPTSHAVALTNVFREDRVDHEISSQTALRNAPEKEESGFKVPRII